MNGKTPSRYLNLNDGKKRLSDNGSYDIIRDGKSESRGGLPSFTGGALPSRYHALGLGRKEGDADGYIC